MTEDKVDTEYTTVCGYAEYEEGELIDILKTLNGITIPHQFENRIIDIDENNPKESNLIFTDSSPAQIPDENSNTILINVSDNEIHLHSDFQYRFLSDIQGSFKEAATVVGNIDIRSFWARYKINVELKDLALPLDWGSDFDISGVRIKKNNSSLIFQSLEGGAVEVTQELDEDFEVNEENKEVFIEDRLKNSEEFLDSLIKQ